MSTSPLPRTIALAALLGGTAACSASSDGPTAPPGDTPVQWLTRVSGDLQEGVPGTELAQPLVVRVGSEWGSVAGVEVRWRLVAGEGTFEPATTVLAAGTGEASVRFRPATHRATVAATIGPVGGAEVQFRTVPRPDAVFVRPVPAAGCGSLCERYTFYPDGTFEFRSVGSTSFPGEFARQDSVFSLLFSANRPNWQALAIRRADTLEVRYNTFMMLSDFEGGRFVLETAASAAPAGASVTAARAARRPGGSHQETRLRP